MKYRYILLILGLLIACKRTDKPEQPENLIPEDKMVEILYDVVILNAAKGSAKTALQKSGIMPQEYVFVKYDIDSLQFAKSNEFYSYDLATYERIINQVDTLLSVKQRNVQARIDAEVAEKKRVRDSLKKLQDSINKQRKLKDIKKRDSTSKTIRPIDN
ncbi:MAG: DUF4296 domain-containing protein [Bacteroidota bacterium]